MKSFGKGSGRSSTKNGTGSWRSRRNKMAGYRRKTRRTLVKNKTVEMNKNKKGFSRKKNCPEGNRKKNETTKSIGERRNESRN